MAVDALTETGRGGKRSIAGGSGEFRVDVSALIGEMAGALVLAIGLCSGHPRQAFGGDKTEVELQGFRGELQLIKSGGGGGDRDSFPEEGAPRSSGFNHAATSKRRLAFSGGADPLDDDIPF